MKNKNKKINQIKAEEYDENAEVDVEIDIEDDYYEDDDLSTNENIISSTNEPSNFEEEYEEKEEYEDAKKTFRRANSDKTMKIFNIIFIVLMILMILISIDVVCVSKYNKGPFFAIKTATYDDGGTKVYYGLGYKVIKYNVTDGRKDTKLGFWNMPYTITPTEIEDIDLAIEFQNDPEKTANKYYKQYLKIESEIKEVNTDENKLVLQYVDPDGKYTLEIDCSMAKEKEDLINYTEQQKLIVRGTVYKFTLKNDDRANAIYLSDCYTEQVIEDSE